MCDDLQSSVLYLYSIFIYDLLHLIHKNPSCIKKNENLLYIFELIHSSLFHRRKPRVRATIQTVKID